MLTRLTVRAPRCSAGPGLLRFSFGLMNIVDILAIAPWWIMAIQVSSDGAGGVCLVGVSVHHSRAYNRARSSMCGRVVCGRAKVDHGHPGFERWGWVGCGWAVRLPLSRARRIALLLYSYEPGVELTCWAEGGARRPSPPNHA